MKIILFLSQQMQKIKISIIQDPELFLSPQHEPFCLFMNHKTPYLLCCQSVDSPARILTLSDGTHTYMCGLYKFVNLQLRSKVSLLMQNIAGNTKVPRNWFALYQIFSFTPKIIKTYTLSDISYGEQVFLRISSEEGVSYQPRVVGNCFSQNGDFLYFLQNQHEDYPERQLGEIISKDKLQIYGLCHRIAQKHLLSIPFSIIFNTERTVLKIQPSIQPLLRKTVYLQVQGNHSTGTLVAKDKILTVRHAFTSKEPEIGSEINVKIYPYKQTYKAILISQPDTLIDAVILHIVSPQQFLQAHKINAENHFAVDLQTHSKETVKVGQQIRALGFGKYSYSLETFQKVDLLLPTIMTGIVSKTLAIDSEIIMFKTDASLYNGFSGCSIWSEDHQLGMAVFCIKNVSTYNQLYKQNFSYLFRFIGRYFRCEHHKFQNKAKLEQFLKNIDQFTMRKNITVRSRL